MPITRGQKEELLADLIEKFKKAKAVVFSDYRGLSVKNMSKLRSVLREKGIDYLVAKKTLIKKAAAEAGLPEIPAENLEGPISVAFSYEDEILAAKLLGEFKREHEQIKLRSGVMEDDLLDAAGVEVLSNVPSKEASVAQMIGLFKAPVSGFYSILHGTLGGFVRVLKGTSEKGE